MFYRRIRNLEFSGSSENILVIWRRYPGCLHVLNTESASGLFIPPLLEKVVDYSDIRLVKNQRGLGGGLPRSIFGPEPPHTWCYYYEKAELAHQFGNWSTIVELGDEANMMNLEPRDPREWSIFIDAYRRLGRSQEANLLNNRMVP